MLLAESKFNNTNYPSFNQSKEVSMNNQQKNLLKKELINQILKYKLQKKYLTKPCVSQVIRW